MRRYLFFANSNRRALIGGFQLAGASANRGAPARASGFTGGMALFCALLLVGCNPPAGDEQQNPPDGQQQQKELPAGTVAVVAGQPVTLDDVRREMAESGATVSAELALEQLIDRKAMAHEARRLGLNHQPRVKAAIENLLVAELRQTATGPNNIPASGQLEEVALREIFEQNKQHFEQPERRRLALVMTGEEDEAGRRALEEFLERDKSPQTFARLAYEYSTHAKSRYRGGDLGWVESPAQLDELPPDIAEAAFALTPNQPWSEILKLPDDRRAVLWLQEIQPHQPAVFQDLQPQLQALAQKQVRERQETTLRETARKNAKVEMADKTLLNELNQSTEEKAPPPASF